MTAPRILLTGSSGLIGTSLVRRLEQNRISTISLHRKKNTDFKGETSQQRLWDPYAPQPMEDPHSLSGITGAIHLSGVNLAGHRWTPAYKKQIVESRVKPTHALALLLAGLRPQPQVFICASAVGIYGSRGDEILQESSAPGRDFLAETCIAWEKATQPASDAGIRVVHVRFGVVLAGEGGALKQMLPVFRMGLGGRLGSGRQWMSWVALADVSRAVLFALETEGLQGSINVVAPQPVTNAEFTRTLGQVLHRPAVIPAPALALRLAFGEMADAALLGSTRVLPARLDAAGFQFTHPDLADALRSVV